MNNSRIAEIEARCAAATLGPWDWSGGHTEDPRVGFAVHGHVSWDQFGMPDGSYKMVDADFIAHARDDVPWLIARVRALEAGLQTIDNLINAPQWDSARRWRVGEIARAALAGES